MSETKLIVGLGNPGKSYSSTRHNFGFMVADLLAQQWGVKFKPSSFTKAVIAEHALNEQKVCLLKPLTFMNHSGMALKHVMEAENLSFDNILVVCDDLNLPMGRLKIRPKGSDGGNNGLKSIIYHLESEDFPRLRLGIGHPGHKEGVTDYVLQRFSKDEQPVVADILEQAGKCCIGWINEGMAKTMEQFNSSDFGSQN